MKRIVLLLVLIISLSAQSQITSFIKHGDTVYCYFPSTRDSIRVNYGSATANWGGIGGNVNNQADLLSLFSSYATASSVNLKVNISDTANMLLKYLLKTDASATYAPIASPTFTGTVSGITASMVGLGNVTNESKATMFTSPTFTGNAVLGTPASGNFSTGTFTWPTFNQNTTGSASTLTTPRTINGVSFNGSANITVPSDISPGTSGNIMTSNGSLWTSAANNGGYTVVKVSGSDVTNSTTTMADITGLTTGTLSNATTYEFEAMIIANSSTTAGATYQIVLGGSGTGSIVECKVFGTGVTTAADITAGSVATASYITVAGDGVIIIRGYIKTLSSGTATFKIQQAKTTSGSIIARIGSYIKYRQV